MKRNVLAIAIALISIFAVSCGGQKPGKVSFKSDVDTVSYSIAMARTNGFINYLTTQMGVDTAYMKDFVKGFCEGAASGESEAQKAYLAGLQIGQSEIGQVFESINGELFGSSEEFHLNKDNYMNAFIAGATNDFSIMTREEAAAISDRLYNYFIENRVELEYADNKAAGEAYLANKAKEEGVVALPSGVLYKVIEQGKGAIPGPTDKVNVKYKGSLVDGTVFDSTTSGIDLNVNGVIKGWQEILQIMPEGSKYEVFIPYEQGYGKQENPGSQIKPFSALIFEIELLKIVK